LSPVGIADRSFVIPDKGRRPAIRNPGFLWRLRRLCVVIPAKAGIQLLVFLWNRLRRCFYGFDAARRAAAGSLSLLVQRKGTERKHAPEPPCFLRFSTRPGASRTRRPHKTRLGLDTGSRRLPAGAAMLGGGYGSQRQGQRQHPAQFAVLIAPYAS